MKKIFPALIFVITFNCARSQQDITVAFYNVENLMDTIDNPKASDNDFLPYGKYKWNSVRYKKKIKSLATVISKIGDSDGPEVIGLAEVENKNVLKDLVASPELKSYNYSIVHYDSPDERGIDVALLYKEKYFKLISSRIYSAAFLNIKSHTRDVLMVKGVLAKDTIIFMVNHWPSRRAGQEKSEDKRIAVSIMVREAIDSILQKKADAKIILLGDFNDEPFNKSISIELNAKPASSGLKKEELYNPFYNLAHQGVGTVNYSSKWNMFDQLILSTGFFSGKNNISFREANVYHPDWMHYNKNLHKGPYRTFMGTDYKGGYSDHFPVYLLFRKQ